MQFLRDIIYFLDPSQLCLMDTVQWPIIQLQMEWSLVETRVVPSQLMFSKPSNAFKLPLKFFFLQSFIRSNTIVFV